LGRISLEYPLIPRKLGSVSLVSPDSPLKFMKFAGGSLRYDSRYCGRALFCRTILSRAQTRELSANFYTIKMNYISYFCHPFYHISPIHRHSNTQRSPYFSTSQGDSFTLNDLPISISLGEFVIENGGISLDLHRLQHSFSFQQSFLFNSLSFQQSFLLI
jgi:hypothetical protein